VPDPRVAPELLAVAVDSPAYHRAVESYREAERRATDAGQRLDRARNELERLAPVEAGLVTSLEQDGAALEASRARLVVLRHELREVAVAQYVNGGVGVPGSAALDLRAAEERRRQQVLVEAVNGAKMKAVAEEADTARALEERIAATDTELREVRVAVATAADSQEDAGRDQAAANEDLTRRGPAVADARLEARVVGLDFSFVVLDAYVKAAAGIAFVQPACGLRWQALAGIGRTESRHGTHGGAVVGPDGNVSEPIIGIPLDGENGTVEILDTDGGALDGDTVHDRALGPMQFIPSTWRALGLDGNGDGRADPQNLYDATLSAANLLCRVGPLDDDSLRRALFRYNNSTAYVDLVLGRIRGYDAFVIPQ
jgi:membrane-bound lytic murein transglycosylase B